MLPYLYPLTSVLGILIGVGVAWGALKSTVDSLKREVDKLHDISSDVAALKPQVEAAHDEMNRLRECVEDTRESMQHLQTEVAILAARR